MKYLIACKLSKISRWLVGNINKLDDFCKSLEESTRNDLNPRKTFEETFNPLQIPIISVPMISVSPGNAAEQLDTAIKSFSRQNIIATRDRPYNGQPHTEQGERGKTLVQGLTVRDVCDCFIKGLLLAQPIGDDFLPCWDFTTDKVMPTKYLLDQISQIPTPSNQLARKADLGLWSYQDVYSMDTNYDPVAAMQNAACEIEKMMGIYPNIKELKGLDIE